jgi:mannan endo-1,4-beta-mannosidase
LLISRKDAKEKSERLCAISDLASTIERTGKMPIPQERINILWGRHPAYPHGAKSEAIAFPKDNAMRKISFLLISALAFLLIIFTGFSQAARAREFTVRGTKIFAPNGQQFIIKGANIGIWTDQSSAKDVRYIKNVWKFNAVRLSLAIKPGSDPNWYATDELVNKYVKAYASDSPRTVIILECHDRSGSFYTEYSHPSLQDLRNFWRKTANRYKNNPYVWFNIMNEPGSKNQVEKNWYDLHKLLIQDIRKAGANNIIVVDGYNFGTEDGNGTTKANFVKDSSSAFLTYGQQLLQTDPKKRVVFSLHTYVNWTWNVDKLYNFVDRVQKKGLAMIIGEYAVNTGDGQRLFDVSEAAKNTLEVSRQRSIGRLVWHYWAWDGNVLATAAWGAASGDGVNKTDGSRPTNLTWLGEKVWDDAHNIPEKPMGIPLNRFAWRTESSQGNPALAIDNDPRTQFTIDQPTPSDWFLLDLGSKQSFNRIFIDPRKAESYFLRDYKVYVSDSAKSPGKLVANVKGNEMSCLRVSFPTQKARYIKIVPQKFGKEKDPSWSFAEIFVYRAGTEKQPAMGKKELNPRNWQASASRKGTWGEERENKAIDRSSDTRYTSTGAIANGDWFQVDLRSPQQVKSIIMNAGSSADDYLTRFEVYVGSDPNKFGKPVYQGLGSPVTRIALNSPARGRYIRVVNKQDKKSWWSIHDFRVFQ